jgi:hypothetical protein
LPHIYVAGEIKILVEIKISIFPKGIFRRILNSPIGKISILISPRRTLNFLELQFLL